MSTELHIGEKIREQLERRGMTIVEFARRINTSRNNVYGIFERKSMDTDQLTLIGKVLDFDFFQFYITNAIPVGDGSNNDQRLIDENARFQKQIEYQEKIERDARELIESKNELIRILKEKIKRLEEELEKVTNEK